MSQYNKTKGSQFETDVMKWLRKCGVIAERLTKAGAKDEGDIVTVIAEKPISLNSRTGQHYPCLSSGEKHKLRRLTMLTLGVLGKSLCHM